MHTHYEKAAACVKTLNKKGEGLWSHLVLFAVEVGVHGHDVLKDNFKEQEKLATVEAKVEMGKNSTYKVAKSVLVRACEYGVAIVDASGKPRGKTDIEKELEAHKTKKPAPDRFKIVMNSASTIADELTAHECITATALVQDLLNKLAPRIKVAA